MKIDIRQPGWVGYAFGIFSSLQGWLSLRVCVPCNVLKIAWGSVGKVMDGFRSTTVQPCTNVNKKGLTFN